MERHTVVQDECGVDDAVQGARCVFALGSRESRDQTGENPQLLSQNVILQSLEPEQEETHALSADLHTHTHTVNIYISTHICIQVISRSAVMSINIQRVKRNGQCGSSHY